MLLSRPIALIAFCCAALPASAAPLDQKQIQIVAKVFNYLGSKPPPGATVVVVGDAAPLDAVKAALPGLTVIQGGAAQSAGAFAALVGSQADAKAAIGANAKVITIGGEVGCVDTAACVIAIETQPKISIYVSHNAAASAGVTFDAGFKMLMTEH